MTYSPIKAAQTVAYLALKSGTGELNVLKAVKLVYLADRMSLQKYGFPIQDENRVSMPHGPVNSETYSFIQGERDAEAAGWSGILRDREDHKVSLSDPTTNADDLDELSEADLEVLDQVWDQFGHMDRFELRDWTHDPKNVPEWEDPSGSSTTIPMGRMLNIMGIENAQDQADEIYTFDQLDTAFKSLV